MVRNLSKSKLMAFRQCARRGWLESRHSELIEYGSDTRAKFATGHEIGDVAQSLFGGADGHLVEYRHGMPAALATTRRLLSNPRDSQPIFEATFRHAGILVRLDILLRDGGRMRLVEVKASTSLKDEHLADCAIQAFISRAAGLTLDSVSLAHVDRTFVYRGDGDYSGLLLENDITDTVGELAAQVPDWIESARRLLDAGEPDVPPGRHCFDPYECGFLGRCWPAAEYPVRALGGSREALGRLVAAGYADLRDVPAELLTSDTQRRIWRVTRQGRAERGDAAREFLRRLSYPRFVLDFETFGPAVPRFAGQRPYDAVPFQFSLHARQADGNLAHQSFLDLSGRDPSRACAEALIAALAEPGPVLVYTSYEQGVIARLAARLPDLAGPLAAIGERLVDLHPVAKESLYHPAMHGSWSLKALLPIVAPDLSYAALGEVQDGGMATSAYAEAISDRTSSQRKHELRAALERYCALDTLALLRLADYLAADGPVADA